MSSFCRDKLIFLIDDEEEVGKLCIEFMGAEDFDLRYFGSAQAALNALKEGAQPRLFVTDFMMPRMNGTQFVRELRKMGKDQPVLMLSGFSDRADIMQNAELGIVGILEKPFSQVEFVHFAKTAFYFSALADLNRSFSEAIKGLSDSIRDGATAETIKSSVHDLANGMSSDLSFVSGLMRR